MFLWKIVWISLLNQEWAGASLPAFSMLCDNWCRLIPHSRELFIAFTAFYRTVKVFVDQLKWKKVLRYGLVRENILRWYELVPLTVTSNNVRRSTFCVIWMLFKMVWSLILTLKSVGSVSILILSDMNLICPKSKERLVNLKSLKNREKQQNFTWRDLESVSNFF